MTKEQIRNETTEIAKRVLKHGDFELTDEMTVGDIKGWDSLSHMVIISEVEKHFNIKLSFTDVLNFENMADLFNCVLSKLN
jgi:acyl carrier protein